MLFEKDANNKMGDCFYTITPVAETGKTFSDQTGRFPVTSSKGNKYIMIMYDYDANSISGEAIKSRTGEELVRAFTVLHEQLKKGGLCPKIHRLDNECPANLKLYMKDGNIEDQLVPPHMHRRDTAENAIATFKERV